MSSPVGVTNFEGEIQITGACSPEVASAWFFGDAESGNWIAGRIRLNDRSRLCRVLGIEEANVTDHQVVLLAYARWGSACAARLAGTFACVVWHRGEHVFTCMRDRLGLAPFYYSTGADRLVFGGDLELVAGVDGVDNRLDEPVVAAHLLDRGFSHPTRTFLRGVVKVPAASVVEIRSLRARSSTYWDPAAIPDVRFEHERDYVDCLAELIERSVGDAVGGAARVGVHLSGGLDSTAVAHAASGHLSGTSTELLSFAWEPPRSDVSSVVGFDERDLIDDVRVRLGISLQYLTTGTAEIVEVLRRDVTRQPTEDTLVRELTVVKNASHAGVDVLLSGWGGDELVSFNGRGHMPGLARRGRLLDLYRMSRERSRRPLRFLFVNGVEPNLPSSVLRMLGRVQAEDQATFESFVDPELARSHREEIATLSSDWHAHDVRSYQLGLLGSGHLASRIESWHHAGSRRGVEHRFPLLDQRVVEFALGLPPDQFIDGRLDRCLMRRTVKTFGFPAVADNTDKSDPAMNTEMYDESSLAMFRTWQAVGDRTSVDLPKARYLDMDRLRRRMDSGRAIGPDESRSVWHALQFLGVPER